MKERHLKLKSIHYEIFSPVEIEKGKKWGLNFECCGFLKCENEGGPFEIHFKVSHGAKWNGASTPKPFRWFLPNWDRNNKLYNLTAMLHDMFYACSGCGLISRSEADDILRGGWREAGYSRSHASTGNFLVSLFACKHWGADEFGASNFFEFYIKKGNLGEHS